MADSLDEYSLLKIFELLPCHDRLNVEIVCKRWKAVCERSWRNFNELEACQQALDEDEFIDFFLCKSILQRCYNYITKLNLSCSSHSKEDTLMDFDVYDNGHTCTGKSSTHYDIKSALLNCCNIQHLTISSCILECNDELLSELFEINHKLHSVELIQLKLSGSCFSKLSFEYLKSLILETCLIAEVNFDVLAQNRIHISCLSLRQTEIVCGDISHYLTPSLQQLDLSLRWIDEPYEVFLGEHTHQLAMTRITLNPALLENVTILILQHTQIDNHLLSLISTHCGKLLALDISSCDNVSDQGLLNLANLSKLKCLKVDNLYGMTDEVCQRMSPNLRIVSAMDTRKITSRGYAMIALLPFLETIIIGHDGLKSDEVNQFIDLIREHERNVPLEIELYDVPFSVDDLTEMPPSLQVNIGDHTVCYNFSAYLY